MTKSQDHLLDWLRDAHAMEQYAEQVLVATAGRLEQYPDLRAGIQRHIDETKNQATLVKSCIDRLGGSNSVLKDFAGRMSAITQGLGSAMVSDEVVKDLHSSYVFEHFEIASYRTLIAAAEAVGDRETAEICRRIIKEEEAMAEWLSTRFDGVVGQFLSLEDTAGASGKR